MPAARLRVARWLAGACVVLMLVVVAASAWLRLAQPRPACADWPGCRSAAQPARLAAAPTRLGHPGVIAVVRAAHRVAASTVLVVVIALAAIALGRRPRDVSLGGRALAMLALALGLAGLGIVTPGARSAAVLLGNLLGGVALLALAWSTLRGLQVARSPAAALAPWAASGALLWLAQTALGALAGAGHVEAAPVAHLAFALAAGPLAFAVGWAATGQGCLAEGRALLALAPAQMALGGLAALAAASPALVLLHNAAAATGVALLWGLATARRR